MATCSTDNCAASASEPVGTQSGAALACNAGKIDEFTNSQESTFIDRLGNTRTTLKGFEGMAGRASPWPVPSFFGTTINLPRVTSAVVVYRDGRQISPEDYELAADGLSVTLSFEAKPSERYVVMLGGDDTPSGPTIIQNTTVINSNVKAVYTTQNIGLVDDVEVGHIIITRSYFTPGSLSNPDNLGLGAAMYRVEPAGVATVTNRDFATANGLVAVLMNDYRKYPECYGVEYGSTADGTRRTRNRDRLQSCLDNTDYVFFSGRIETFGSVKPQRGQTWQGVNPIVSRIENWAANQPAVDDGKTQIGQNLQGWKCYEMYINSFYSDAIRVTPFQCEFVGNRFSARRGKCFDIRNVAYQSENHWERNIFYAYEYAIYAPGRNNANPIPGTYDFVDGFFIHNIYDAGTDRTVTDPGGGTYTPQTLGGIYIPKASSTIIRGEHLYKRHNGPMITISGLNIELTDVLFEENNNHQLMIESGNPVSVSVKGTRFWFGDGNSTTGEQTARIGLRGSEFNPFSITFTGCSFQSGKNGVDVFLVYGGDNPSKASRWNVKFGKDNILVPDSGDYGAYNLVSTTDQTQRWAGFIDSDHEEFLKLSSTDDESITSPSNYSEFVQLGISGETTENKYLPSSPNCLRGKSLYYTNASTDLTVTFLGGGGSPPPVEGFNPVPPGSKVKITEHPDRNKYLILPA